MSRIKRLKRYYLIILVVVIFIFWFWWTTVFMCLDNGIHVEKEKYKNPQINVRKEVILQGKWKAFEMISRSEFHRKRIKFYINTAAKYFTKNSKHGANRMSNLTGVAHKLHIETLCPLDPPELFGKISTSKLSNTYVKMQNIAKENMDIYVGGYWKPKACKARDEVAIIIPYRDRKEHLSTLLDILIPMLKRQQLEFQIFVTEQIGNKTFNKGRLMNSGFIEATKLFSFKCVIFHDVDLLPEDDRNMYTCPLQPTHLSHAVDEMNYKLRYDMLVGGVLNMRKDHFELVNGYSNEYWGWGAEDDDMAYRILLSGLRILRPPITIARYKMIHHQKRKPSSWIKSENEEVPIDIRNSRYIGLQQTGYNNDHEHEEQFRILHGMKQNDSLYIDG